MMRRMSITYPVLWAGLFCSEGSVTWGQSPQAEPARTTQSAAGNEKKEEKTPIKASREIIQFVEKEVSKDPDAVIEISELGRILDEFERKRKVFLPGRDVLETQETSARELMEALDRALTSDPSKVKKVTSVSTRIEGGKSLSQLKPFQRRDALNNPDKLLEVKGGLGGGSKEVVARAILRVRPDLADGRRGPAFSRYANSSAPISDADYTRIVREFLARPKADEFEQLDIAIQRAQNTPVTGNFSNGKPRKDAKGNDVFPNGSRRYDNQGRPLYPNGKRQFDDRGEPLHSNGKPKYTGAGVPLTAAGAAKPR
ncbi:hypothetical protein K2X85_10255 [bacterium]|jgi:hypothetical protein|nr:hypothetical protein [bacterium]